MPKNTTQCPRPGLEPGPLDPEASALDIAMKTAHLTSSITMYAGILGALAGLLMCRIIVTCCHVPELCGYEVLNYNQRDCRYLLSRSRAIALGLSRSEEIKRLWLLPSRSDTDIVSYVVSVQYSCDALQSTAGPSQAPMPVIIVVVFDSSMRKRLMFLSVTSLQNM